MNTALLNLKLLMILTSHDIVGATNRKFGLCLKNFTTPYYRFKDAGALITLSTELGGQPLIASESFDPFAQVESTKRFRYDSNAQMLLANTRMLSTIVRVDFDAVFFPGGPGTIGFFPKLKNQTS